MRSLSEMVIPEHYHSQPETCMEEARQEPMDRDPLCNSEDLSTGPINSDDDQPADRDNEKNCDEEGKYKCEFCDRRFSRRSNMKRHVMKHTGERPYDCPHCEMKFSLKSTLQNHLRLHTGEKPYTCETCQKTFRQKSNYSIHRKLHTGEGSHVCEVCGRQFVQKGHFELHLLGHSGVKSYSCQHCDKRFSHSSLLKQHSIIHKEDKERKIYICSICDKRFCTNRTLEFHLKAHAGIKDFQCKNCGKTFQQRNALNRHMRQNELSDFGLCHNRANFRERGYECNFCLRKFKTKAMLRNHIYAHTGEKPFECKECNRKFTTKSSLKLHLKVYCKGKRVCQEDDSNLCNVHSPAGSIGEITDVAHRSSVMFERLSSRSESSTSEDDIFGSSLAEVSKGNVHNTSIPSKSFTSLGSRPVFSTIASSSSDESVPTGGIEKMTKYLSLSQDLGSACMPKIPSSHFSVLNEGKCTFAREVKSETNSESANSDSLETTERLMTYNNPSINSSISEDLHIKEEIEVVDEDIDEMYNL